MAHLIVTPDARDAAHVVADLIGRAVVGRAPDRALHIALAGGRTPQMAYARLRELVDDWDGVELWLGDERMVPADSPDANVAMARTALGPAASARLHPVPTDRPPQAACDAYADLLGSLPRDAAGLPMLDVALLGLGEDGHTASLFPNRPELEVRGVACVVVHDAPKPPPTRISLTLPVLNAATQRIVLATGQSKAGAVAAALEAPDPRIPASLLVHEGTTWVLDEAAASSLDSEEERA